MFVCENNLYSMSTPLSLRQSNKRNRVKIAQENGLLSFQENGNNLEKVSALAKQGVSHLRSGKGPVYIEFETYRFYNHAGPNQDTSEKQRSEKEQAYWKNLCPLKLYAQNLLKEKILSSDLQEEMELKIAKEINEAFNFADNSPFPEFDLDYEKAYAE